MKKLKVGIIGCGFIGNKRAKCLSDHKISFVSDLDIEKAKKLAKECDCKYSQNYLDVINSDVDVVIVATTHNMLSIVASEAIKKGKHVFIEKPGAINYEEIKKLINLVDGTNIKVKVGFNHRYHPAIVKAKEIVDSGKLGEILFIRARYGHGGRVGYQNEWRAKKSVSGGGELIDQGSHIIDLGRFFLGDFCNAKGYVENYFWDMEVEDNCFALLRTKKNQVMQMHVSWTEWKNLFSFEIMCKFGKLEISGLGGSYGEEKLIVYKMKKEMGIPDKKEFIFPKEDKTWNLELIDLFKSIENNTELLDLKNSYECLKLIQEIYGWDYEQKKCA